MHGWSGSAGISGGGLLAAAAELDAKTQFPHSLSVILPSFWLFYFQQVWFSCQKVCAHVIELFSLYLTCTSAVYLLEWVMEGSNH